MTVHYIVRKAILSGALVPQSCQGSARSGACHRTPVVAHHDDYAKPLEVRWLCRLHHTFWHRDNVALNRHLRRNFGGGHE